MKNAKKLLAVVLAVGCVMFNAEVAKAADTNEVTTNDTSSASVSLEVPSTFSVLIPKTITITGNPGTGSYTVGVKGDIGSDKKVVVTPASTVTMSQASKTDIMATVAQTKTEWTYDEINTSTYSETTGTLTTPSASAGIWTGTMTFTVSLVNVTP